MKRIDYLKTKIADLRYDIANEADSVMAGCLEAELKKTEAELDELVKKNCTNCAYCERFEGYNKNYKPAPCMRCWEEPDVCDHPISMTIEEAKYYTCENHRTVEEREQEKIEEATYEVRENLNSIKRLFKQYPTLKDKFKNEIQELRG